MGKTQIIKNVCLVAAICWQSDKEIMTVINQLTAKFGPIDLESPSFLFNHTNYYKLTLDSGSYGTANTS